MIGRTVVFYQNMTEVPHIILLHILHRNSAANLDQLIAICLICSMNHQTLPTGVPVMPFSAKYVFFIC